MASQKISRLSSGRFRENENDKNAGNQRSNYQSVLKNVHHQKEGGNQNGGNYALHKV